MIGFVQDNNGTYFGLDFESSTVIRERGVFNSKWIE